jgi:hydroxymethylpyrimidine/phosphomethylpyrimidine kinase
VKPPRILVIAGSDSSGGAGIQADIKTITLLGGYAMTAITAVTAQNTLGVATVTALEPELVAAQIDACVSDIGVDAIKIGMLGSAQIAYTVVTRIAGLGVPLVFDPVMVASSGGLLADAETVAAFDRLMALATLVTPNVTELAALGGADSLRARGLTFLAKGGDAPGDMVEDVLHHDSGTTVWRASRIATRQSHGTGCTLASAIATGLGAGLGLVPAITRARQLVRAALRHAPGFGTGDGPMGHHALGHLDWEKDL